MRQRAEAARRAVETVRVHADGGLFGDIPLAEAAGLFPAVVASARDVPTLIAEVQRLVDGENTDERVEAIGEALEGMGTDDDIREVLLDALRGEQDA
jgi:hypothetical protein